MRKTNKINSSKTTEFSFQIENVTNVTRKIITDSIVFSQSCWIGEVTIVGT